MTDYSRRLPVYLVLDCSESMVGHAIEAVSQGVNTLVAELRRNPLALETAYLSVITFSRTAVQEVPLTELLRFQPPKLTVKTGTALGAALHLLSDCLGREVVRTTETTKGDYKPLVFILTDGQPTDDWDEAAAAIKSAREPKVANIYAIGCGPDVDIEVLYHITDAVLLMPDLSPEAMRKFFVWLSASVQTASTSMAMSSDAAAINLPALPEGAMSVASGPVPSRGKTASQVFLHARCSKTKQPYLMRYAMGQYGGLYDAVAAHRLETIEDDAEALPPINSSLLNGCPACPYCENPVAALCPCGTLFCASETQDTVVCPKCDSLLAAGNKTEFDIKRIQG